jgi:hypothetical protein
VAPTFAVLAALTLLWTVHLAMTLPRHIETRHYRGAWVGFDLGLAALLIVTAYLAWRGQRHVGLTATATATTLVIDAWFDVTTSPTRVDLAVSVATAAFAEIPLALLCLWIALHVDRVVARRLRSLAHRAERAEVRGTWGARLGARAVRLGARGAETGVRVAAAGTRVADTGVRVAEAGVRAAEAPEPLLVERPDGHPGTG